MSIQQAPLRDPINVDKMPWIRYFQNLFDSLQGISTQGTSTFNGDIDVTTGNNYSHAGVDGISETLTFGGGASGEVATITVSGGIITARTLVP